MRAVKFPMYFEVCGYQTIPLPDNIDANDEFAVREYISDQWPGIKLPEEYDYVGDDGLDFEAPIEIIDYDNDEVLVYD